MSLAVVRDLREARAPAGPEELAAFETDVLAGFVGVVVCIRAVVKALAWAFPVLRAPEQPMNEVRDS